eukprot:1152615-Pelagomonas_calceolata.AAC.7
MGSQEGYQQLPVPDLGDESWEKSSQELDCVAHPSSNYTMQLNMGAYHTPLTMASIAASQHGSAPSPSDSHTQCSWTWGCTQPL